MTVADVYMPVNEAIKFFPGRPHLSTIHRWCEKGVRGIKLESMLCGSRRYVTEDAISKFLTEQNKTDGERLEEEGC